MKLYVQFLFFLAFGLLGLSFVLKVLLDTLFNEWDVLGDLRRRYRAYISGKGRGHSGLLRPEDILIERETAGVSQGSLRLIDRRRQQLRELEAAASRSGGEEARTSDTLASVFPS